MPESEARIAERSTVTGGDWVAAMRAGDFARAWAINDADLPELCRAAGEKHSGPRHLQRIWRGEQLAGKRVLVRCYHGLGDTIQFVRFLPALHDIASAVILWCQPALCELLHSASGIDRLLPLHDGLPDAEFDVDIEIMEVPHAIRATRDLVEVRSPYLKLPRAQDSLLQLRAGFSVGLVWDVGEWGKRRCVPPHLLRKFGGEGLNLYSLQRGPGAEVAPAVGAVDISTPNICSLGHRIRQMNIVVCVDTMVAHLAGALGCEAWVLLEYDCDWRWPAREEATPWYPTLRLFHQPAPDDWGGAVENVRLALLSRASRI